MNQHDPLLLAKIQWLKRATDLDDEDFLLALESETDFREQCEWMTQAIVELEYASKGVGQLIADYNTKQDRLDGRALYLRRRLLRLMEEAGQRSLKCPAGTVSATYPKHGRALITDADLLPDDYWQTTRKPMLTLIGSVLKEGQSVPGATLGNPEPFLTIRVK